MFYYDYWQCEEFFNKDECGEILEYYSSRSFDKDRYGASFKEVDSTVCLIEQTDPYIDKIHNYVSHINKNYFGFDINCIPDTINLNRYKDDQNNYNWHIDGNTGEKITDIKLTAILNISPNTFTGGDFYINPSQSQHVESISKTGTLLIFPSYYFHKVENVTSGERITLSTWYEGPKLK